MATQDRLPTGSPSVVWTPSGDSTPEACVDDPIGSPDGGTTYIYSDSAGQVQELTFTAFDIFASSVNKITVTAVANKNALTGPTMSEGIKVGGTLYYGAAHGVDALSYATYTTDWLTNPATGVAWAQDDVNGSGTHPLEALAVKHESASNRVRVTQTYITADYVQSSEDHTGTADILAVAVADFAGTAAEAASGTISVSAASSFTAAGTLAEAASGTVSISGTGSITMTGQSLEEHSGAADVSATGAIIAAGSALEQASGTARVDEAGAVTITGTPLEKAQGDASVAAVSGVTLSGSALEAASGQAPIPGTGTIQIQGAVQEDTNDFSGEASAAGAGAISIEGQAREAASGAVSLTSLATLSIEGTTFQLVVGEIAVAFTVKSPAASFTARRPNVTFS